MRSKSIIAILLGLLIGALIFYFFVIKKNKLSDEPQQEEIKPQKKNTTPSKQEAPASATPLKPKAQVKLPSKGKVKCALADKKQALVYTSRDHYFDASGNPVTESSKAVKTEIKLSKSAEINNGTDIDIYEFQEYRDHYFIGRNAKGQNLFIKKKDILIIQWTEKYDL